MSPEEKKYGVFISYSHEDAKFVSPIVSLISSMRKDLVFQDTKTLKLGKKWEPQLSKALDEAEVIILFWCKHSANSDYVKKEYEQAIKSNKDILPVLLDDSKLQGGLADYQWIDFQDVISHSPAKFRWIKLLWIVPLILLIGIFTLPFLINLNSYDSNAQSSETDKSTVFVFVLVALIFIFLVRLLFRKPKPSHGQLNSEAIASEIKSKLNEKLPPK